MPNPMFSSLRANVTTVIDWETALNALVTMYNDPKSNETDFCLRHVRDLRMMAEGIERMMKEAGRPVL